MKKLSFRDLEIWKKGITIAELTGDIIENLPRRVIYGFGSHLDKTSVSIASNIAEGNIRRSTKEYIQFLYYSLG
ncbi:MAG TPA: four helix bundle protein, partial [Firmicutes bacterium]|nr:four helix bundle protein [Bacillota bacterium]